MIELSELLSPRDEHLRPLVKQSGVNSIVALLNGGEQDQRMFASVGKQSSGAGKGEDLPWSERAIRRDMDSFADSGLRVAAIEDTPPLDAARLGLPGRDQEIEEFITQVRAMGRLDIPVLCYNWMALSSWARTDTEIRGRGGALVTGFRGSDSDSLPGIVEVGDVSEQQLWDGLKYFLDAVLPVAEEVGVRLALHPDDPPRNSVRNIPRIMSSPAAFRRLLALHPSPSNAITLCQGNFALMTSDVPSLIREFGAQDHIAFVHYRDVRGTAEDFEETFHDEGQTDMVECMRAYAQLGYAGLLRPDHVPTMFGESNDRPGYGSLGRLFALGYIRGMAQSAYHG